MKRCGMSLLATMASLALAACESDPVGPQVVDLADHREIRLRFSSAGERLSGTLYMPKEGGPYTTIVEHQGSAWTTRSAWSEIGSFVLGADVAFFSYDRRGFGDSTGTTDGMTHEEFAEDLGMAMSAVSDLTEYVDPDRRGLLGGSFGGWIVPLSANDLGDVVDFVVVGVGGVVSSGQEALYDELTGHSECEPTGTPIAEITQALRDAGPSGFDPRASLEALGQPALWIFGGNDLSHPTDLSLEILDEMNPTGDKDWTALVFPEANHSLIAGGAICQEEGEVVDFISPMIGWLEERGLLADGGVR